MSEENNIFTPDFENEQNGNLNETASAPETTIEQEITLKDAIGHLPSLKNGECSSIPFHYALKHNERQVECMSHTHEGCSAMKNPIYYPKKATGEKQEKGPVIICIDTSGSMNGEPEDIAKSLSLFILLECIKEKRSCYIISFFFIIG